MLLLKDKMNLSGANVVSSLQIGGPLTSENQLRNILSQPEIIEASGRNSLNIHAESSPTINKTFTKTSHGIAGGDQANITFDDRATLQKGDNRYEDPER